VTTAAGSSAVERALARTVAAFNAVFGTLGVLHGGGYLAGAWQAARAAGEGGGAAAAPVVAALGGLRLVASLALVASAPLLWRRAAAGRVVAAAAAVAVLAASLAEPALLPGQGAGWGEVALGSVYFVLLLGVLLGRRGRARFVADLPGGAS